MKHTKHKLLSSIATLFVCLAMFIGSTYAWFTDSASTGVNKIQAGNLDVLLEMNNGTSEAPVWVNAEGKTLQFKKAAGAPEDEQVLWEPGCTYELPALRVVNKGNLNLKYKIEITGIQGDAKLNEAIVWTINDDPINLVDEELAAGAEGSGLVIKGHMKEEAGNEYKNLTIDGISITVYATQAEGEFDSFGDDYDAGAEYVKKTATIMSETDGKTYTLESGKTYTVGSATVTVNAAGDISYANPSGTQTVSITTDGGKLTVDAPNDTVKHYGESDFVDVNAIAGNSFHEFGKVGVLSVVQGRVVAENGNNIDVIQVKGASDVVTVAVPENKTLETKLEKAANVTSITLKVINSTGAVVNHIVTENGTVTDSIPEELKKVLSSDTPTINEAKDYVARVGNVYYGTLDAAISAAKSGDTVVLLKDSAGNGIVVNSGSNFTVNFNNYTYNVDGATVGSSGTETNGFQLLKDSTLVFKNGKITSSKAKILLQNYSNLTLDNMYLDGENIKWNYVLSNNNGNVVIKDTTINAPNKVAFDVCRYASYDGPYVTVEGNSVINGDVEISSSGSKDGAVHKLTVTGGTFNGKIYNSGSSPDFVGDIKGGTFSSDPSDFLGEGYSAVKNGNIYTIKELENYVGSQEALESLIDSENEITINLGAGSYTLTSGKCRNKTVTIIGAGDKTSLNITEKNNMSYQNGATLVFENMTVLGQTSGNYGGMAHTSKVTYKNCTIKGKLTLYAQTEEFLNCVLENKEDYSIWTWGAKNVLFDHCTFNSGGKALLLYGGAGSSEAPTTVLNVVDCTFNDDDDTLDPNKAAIETGDDYGATYVLTVKNTTVNGFAINPKGTNTGTTLWANKNSMDKDHLSVEIDGVKKY